MASSPTYVLRAPHDSPGTVSFSLNIGDDVTLDDDGTLRNKFGTALCRLVRVGNPVSGGMTVQPLHTVRAVVPPTPGGSTVPIQGHGLHRDRIVKADE